MFSSFIYRIWEPLNYLEIFGTKHSGKNSQHSYFIDYRFKLNYGRHEITSTHNHNLWTTSINARTQRFDGPKRGRVVPCPQRGNTISGHVFTLSTWSSQCLPNRSINQVRRKIFQFRRPFVSFTIRQLPPRRPSPRKTFPLTSVLCDQGVPRHDVLETDSSFTRLTETKLYNEDAASRSVDPGILSCSEKILIKYQINRMKNSNPLLKGPKIFYMSFFFRTAQNAILFNGLVKSEVVYFVGLWSTFDL